MEALCLEVRIRNGFLSSVTILALGSFARGKPRAFNFAIVGVGFPVLETGFYNGDESLGKRFSDVSRMERAHQIFRHGCFPENSRAADLAPGVHCADISEGVLGFQSPCLRAIGDTIETRRACDSF